MTEKRLLREKAWSDINLYPVITGRFCAERKSEAVLEEILKGGARAVQLREKKLSDREYYKLATIFRELTFKYGALLIIDDRVDIALAVNADGVHLGTEDMPCDIARKLAPDLIIGTSTHNLEEINSALLQDISYLNIGPIYGTMTKETGFEPLGEKYLEKAIEKLNIPFTVMGGIKFHNLDRLFELGVRNAAMVTALTASENPRLETEKFLQKIKLLLK
ncbi:MAG: thiamine phosphate synthase [Deltaproteobacteria bacterium]|nr:thiamine phosphate synthase [Deltaproteobacteria bacterium]